MGNVIMKAQQITYGASNVEKALDDLNVPELIELNKRMDAVDAWKANVHEETYTGSELTIENALALPARSLITEINAIQDLHGYDKPWAGGAGKNKLPLTVEGIKAANTSGTWSGNTWTIANMTVEIQTDADNNVTGVLLKGTPSSTVLFYFSKAFDSAANVGNLLSGYPSGYTGSDASAVFRFYTNNHTGDFNITTDDGAIQNIGTCNFIIRINSGYAIPSSGLLFKPMIRISTASSGFEPYSNICPIYGRTEVTITVEGE